MIANSAVQTQQGAVSVARSNARVAVLLSTFNGAPFLREQLDSLTQQTHQNWVIFASDDGSSDATLAILSEYQQNLGQDRLVIFAGPRKGFSANFLSLLKRPELDADYYAYCDQDDIWEADKLERGVRWCETVTTTQPALFCGRTRLIDEAGRPIGYSPLFSEPPSFRNALVQSIAGGNTMLFNAAARALLMKTHDGDQIISHDWWTYLVVAGCGGIVHYESIPTIDYRQHGRNLIGSNSGFKDRIVRLRKLLAGTFKDWNDANLKAMRAVQGQLSNDSQQALALFEQARKSTLFKRLFLISRSGVYRQTLLGNLGLTAAAILQRL